MTPVSRSSNCDSKLARMNHTALITGSNQGIGLGFLKVLLERNIDRIYATARRVDALTEVVALDPKRVVPLELDITNTEHIERAVRKTNGVSLLINNAGIPGSIDSPLERRFIAASSIADARAVMETNYFAQLEMCRAFAPQLLASRGSIINILSIGALFCLPEYASYCAAKAACAILTKGVRSELKPRGVFVAGVYTAGVETRMSMKNDTAKMSPEDHAREVLDAVSQGVEDIYAGSDADALRKAIKDDEKGFEAMHIKRFQENPLD